MKKRLQINSKYNNIKIISSEISQILEKLNVSEQKRFKIRLCIEEILVNAIKHGNKFKPDSVIKVDFEIDKKQFKISIEDEGEGFDYKNIPNPVLDKNIGKAGGRGIFLIRKFMDRVYFNQKGNKITMIKTLK